MMQGSGNTVRNCTISDFDAALYLVNESGAVLEDNRLFSNKVGVDLSNGGSNTIIGNVVCGGDIGLKITNSNDNTIASNAVCGNVLWDIYHCCSAGNVGLDNICDTTLNSSVSQDIVCTLSCTVFSCGFETGDLTEWSSW